MSGRVNKQLKKTAERLVNIIEVAMASLPAKERERRLKAFGRRMEKLRSQERGNG